MRNKKIVISERDIRRLARRIIGKESLQEKKKPKKLDMDAVNKIIGEIKAAQIKLTDSAVLKPDTIGIDKALLTYFPPPHAPLRANLPAITAMKTLQDSIIKLKDILGSKVSDNAEDKDKNPLTAMLASADAIKSDPSSGINPVTDTLQMACVKLSALCGKPIKPDTLSDGKVTELTQKLFDATEGGTLGLGLGTDENGIKEVIEALPCRLDANQLAQAYAGAYGATFGDMEIPGWVLGAAGVIGAPWTGGASLAVTAAALSGEKIGGGTKYKKQGIGGPKGLFKGEMSDEYIKTYALNPMDGLPFVVFGDGEQSDTLEAFVTSLVENLTQGLDISGLKKDDDDEEEKEDSDDDEKEEKEDSDDDEEEEKEERSSKKKQKKPKAKYRKYGDIIIDGTVESRTGGGLELSDILDIDVLKKKLYRSIRDGSKYVIRDETYELKVFFHKEVKSKTIKDPPIAVKGDGPQIKDKFLDKAEKSQRWRTSLKGTFLDAINSAIAEKLGKGSAMEAESLELSVELPKGIYKRKEEADESKSLKEGKRLMTGKDILKFIYKNSR